MSRTPLLDQLRASYQRDEDDIRAPIQELLDWQTRNAAMLRRQLSDLGTIIGRKVGDAIFADIGRGLARSIRRQIELACARHHMGEPTFTLTIPTSELRWLNPASLENLVLQGYLLKTRTNMAVTPRNKKIGDQYVTVIVVEMPSLAIEQVVLP